MRAAGIDAPILAWLVPPGEPLTEAIDAGIDLGIGSMWVINEVSDAARQARRQARIHLKVDTGLNRGGIGPADWSAAAAALARAEAAGLPPSPECSLTSPVPTSRQPRHHRPA